MNTLLDDVYKKTTSHEATPRIVLLMDDFHIILSRWKDFDMSRLRSLIFSEGSPILVASGEDFPSALTSYEAPMYDSLAVLSLGDISMETSIQITEEKIKMEPEQKEMAKRVYESIGGTPMISNLTAESLKDNPKDENALAMGVMQRLSPYYRGWLYNLSPTQRTIVIALGNVDGRNLPEIRNVTGIETGSISSALALLRNSGIVRVERNMKRKSRYVLNDKVFVKWLEMPMQTRIRHSLPQIGNNP